MALERSLILVKSDAVERGLVGEVLTRLEHRGYTIVALKMVMGAPERAANHFAEHEGKPFYGELIEDITKAPIVAMVIEGVFMRSARAGVAG